MQRATCCWLALSALAISIVAHAPAVGRGLSVIRSDEILPCYVVISNEQRNESRWREIRIMVEKSDVNEASFIILLRHFSAMYQDADHLDVNVETSLNFTLGNYKTDKDVDDRVAASRGVPYERTPKIWEKDAQGVLRRTPDMEEFGYKTEGGDMRDMQYVLVKGEDPSCHNCKTLKAELVDPQAMAVSQRKATKDGVPCYFEFGNYPTDGARHVGLFINAEDGNEPNLLALLGHISRRYLEPDRLMIYVYTDFGQRNDFLVPTLGDDYSLRGTDSSAHFAATIFRASGSEVIRYRYPNDKVLTLVVRGVDTFPSIRH